MLMQRWKWMVAFVAACTMSAQVQSQQVPDASVATKPVMPSPESMKRAMEEAQGRLRDQQGQSLEREASRAREAISGTPRPAGMPSGNVMPDVSTLMGNRGVDPAKLAQQFGREKIESFGEDRVYRLMVFVSLAMPVESLKRLGRDVKKVGGVLVLRGFRFGIEPGNWEKSIEAMKPVAETGVELQINPALFEQFQVKMVPTMVLSPEGIADKGCSEGRCPASRLAIISGDVTLDYALNTLIDRKDSIGRLARQMSDKLELR